MIENNSTRRLRGDESGDALVSSGIAAIALLFVGLMIIAMTTNPIKIGVDKGEMPPNLTGKARIAETGNEAWFDFDLHSRFNQSWDGNATSSRWYLIQFIDTDCPYCWSEGELMSEITRDDVFGGVLTAVTVNVQLNIQSHTSSRAEIAAFQDKSSFGTDENDGNGCYEGKRNCASRPGDVHSNILYLDNLNSDSINEWNLRGTPACFILNPHGLVQFNSADEGGCDEMIPFLADVFGIPPAYQ